MPVAIPTIETLSSGEKLRASLEGWIPWVGKGSLAVVDQGLFAGTNFIVNILLARWLTPAEYGAFALAFSVFLLLGAFHTASLTEPMMVFGAGKYASCFEKYVGILLCGHFGLMFPASLVLITTAFLLGPIHSTSAEWAFLGLALAAPLILLLWLVRRALYVRLEPGWSALGGATYLLVILAAIEVLKTARTLSPATGFLAMGAGAAVVSGLLLWRVKPRLRGLTSKPATPLVVAADHWQYGRWSLASVGVGWFPSNIYFVLLPVWFGLEAAGALKALMNLAMPILQANSALGLLLLPVLVRSHQEGGLPRMRRMAQLALALFLSGSAVYLALVWAFRSEIIHLLYGGKYQEYASWPLLFIALLPFAESLMGVFGSVLRALERPDWVFWCYLGSSIVTLVIGLPLASRMGVGGAAAGLLISFAATGFLQLFCCKRCLRI
jgi:O-antigen/teichoic acid export membrane protein